MLRIRLERDLGGAARAANVEAEDCDCVVFLLGRLFARIELTPFVDELAAGGAAHAEGRHQADGLHFGPGLLGATAALEFGRVEVGRVVLCEDLTFGHVGGGFCELFLVVFDMRDALARFEIGQERKKRRRPALSDAKQPKFPAI